VKSTSRFPFGISKPNRECYPDGSDNTATVRELFGERTISLAIVVDFADERNRNQLPAVRLKGRSATDPERPLMVCAYGMSEGDPFRGGCERRDELVLLRNWTTQPMCRDGLLDFGTRSSSIIKITSFTMRILCNGVSYDTDRAKLVAAHGSSEWSEAGWDLYQTPAGAYFKVIYGHGGEEVGFTEIPHEQANELIATHKVVYSSYGW